MTRLRLIIFTTTILVVGIVGFLVSLYARGYRFNQETKNFTANGILVANSDPNGASVYINGELKTATNATIPLTPDVYDVEIRKEGFHAWSKRLSIKKEEVTTINVTLFASVPSLSAITFSGVVNPVISPDQTKILYAVPPSTDSALQDTGGLWILETVNLPLGFNREPRRITDGDLTKATFEWSPDSRQILITNQAGAMFLINASEFTSQNQRTNVASRIEQIRADWQQKKADRLEAQINKLPSELKDILVRKTTDIVFSPDEDKILYTASSSAALKDNLIPQLPGSSTQKQTRELKPDKKYVYDIKEDRNFEIADSTQPLYWFPTSQHLIMPEESKISIVDYDGTNKQVVFSGSYAFPHAYSATSNDRILMLTNFGASENLLNLYSLSLK